MGAVKTVHRSASWKMQTRKVKRASSLSGIVHLPGDKSISHRSAMLASIADGTTRIENYAASADCTSTLECMRTLGVTIESDGGPIVVYGVGKDGLRSAAAPLDCGNSGTTMRLLSGILAGQPFETTLTGDDSLRSRPMKRIIEPLELMGASITSDGGRAPLTIRGTRPLDPITYRPPVASAQIKSCVMLAGLFGDGTTTVIEPVPTRDHTERMLAWFGVDVDIKTEVDGTHISVNGDSRLTGRVLRVPGDISAAAFFLVAAACLDGSDITMPKVGANPSRYGIIDVLRSLGADIEVSKVIEACNEPVADIRVRGGLREMAGDEMPVIRGELIANMIDEIPILAVFGTQLRKGLEIRDAGELRVKESDRIAAVVRNLRLMGAEVEEFDDGLRVAPSQLRGASVETYHDHRIAMAFAVAGLFADGETEVIGADCAAVSFPGFFETLESVVM